MKGLLVAVAIVILLIGSCTSVMAKPVMYSLLDLVKGSDLILFGKVMDIVPESSCRTLDPFSKEEIEKNLQAFAVVKVEGCLRGCAPQPIITVYPVWVHGCISYARTMSPGEDVLLFCKGRVGDHGAITHSGDGMRKLMPDTRSEEISAVKRLAEIDGMAEQKDREKAMLSEAYTSSQLLRREVATYITYDIAFSKNRVNYKQELVSLIKSPHHWIRASALHALKQVDVPEAIPLMIEAIKDSDEQVVEAASEALSRYDTPAAIGTLIALTKNPDPHMRMRAAVDLDDKDRPEVKKALAVLLSDRDPLVRAAAPGRFIRFFRDGTANDVIPKIVAMLADPVEDVAAAAAYALGETRDPVVAEPLLDCLRRKDIGNQLEMRVLQALYMLCSGTNADAAIAVVRPHAGLIVSELDKEGYRIAEEAVGILAMLKMPETTSVIERVARYSSNQSLRQIAQHYLKWLTHKD